MIQLENKLRSNSKVVKFLVKISPEIFELKIAKKLDSLIINAFHRYKNISAQDLSPEEFQAICYVQQQLLTNSFIRKIDEEYLCGNSTHNYLSFFKDEINEFRTERDTVSNTLGTGIVNFYEIFNLTNNLVESKMNNTKNLVESYFRNYFIIKSYTSESNPSDESRTLIITNHFNNQTYNNNQSVIFNNTMTIDSLLELDFFTKIDELKKSYLDIEVDKISRSEAYIIDYFLANLQGVDYKDFSKRQQLIPKLYKMSYHTFRDSHKKEFQNFKGDPNIKIESLVKAILYVNHHLKDENFKDYFSTKLLRKMYDYYLFLLNKLSE